MINQDNTLKERHGLTYCTGAHPDIREHNKKGNRPTEFGNKVWATSLVLIDYLETSSLSLNGLRVLEIGCGWGLLGVYLAKRFKCDVTCSDFDPLVLPIVSLHGSLNNVEIKTKVASFSDFTEQELENYDLIIGAEVCYSEEVSRELIHFFEKAFTAKVKHLLIADPGRPDFDDCVIYCKGKVPTRVIELPGSVNGKTTQLLHSEVIS